MNELININIENLIYEVRGMQVMIDSDVSRLFGYETKQLNRNVIRNINRFPNNYCFKLTKDEYENLKCQIGTSSLINNYGGRRNIPYVFTEYGITMLAGMLKSETAISMSFKIVNTFVHLRKFISSNCLTLEKINNKLIEHDNNFEIIFDKLEDKNIVKEKIFFEGQIYDSYSLIIDILYKTTKSIIIIDNYIDKTVLDMATHKKNNVRVNIITSSHYITDLDINKFNKQYGYLNIRYSNKYHDRFIIIDESILYHLGASLKDLGKKCFAINNIEDKEYLYKLIEISKI